MAVSYTHLDVYKRQAITEYIDALDGTPTLTGKTPLEKGVIHMMNKRAELEPVSYTHLDVYKRQLLNHAQLRLLLIVMKMGAK